MTVCLDFTGPYHKKLSAVPPEGTEGKATLLLYTSSINEV